MSNFINHSSFADLERALSPLASTVETKPLRWINAPDGDLCTEWCRDCGYYMVRNLRRKDKKRREDYFLDGGWGTEEERFCFCAGCGVHLEAFLLPEGAYSQLDYFRDAGFSINVAEDAYSISEMLNGLRCTDGSAPKEEAALELYLLAKQFLQDQSPSERPDR